MAKKPVGAYSKGRGASGLNLTPRKGQNAKDVFKDQLQRASDMTETHPEFANNRSQLYAAARKLGIDQRSVKKDIDNLYNFQKKYSNWSEAGTQQMQDMQARSAANRAPKVRNEGGLLGRAGDAVEKIYKTY